VLERPDVYVQGSAEDLARQPNCFFKTANGHIIACGRDPYFPPWMDTGDMLELWSNDLFVSTRHRVINKSGRERYSIPVFYDPDYDARVECLPNCSSAQNPPKHPPMVAGDYILSRYDGTYAYRQPARAW
jgi:hypothetical protein